MGYNFVRYSHDVVVTVFVITEFEYNYFTNAMHCGTCMDKQQVATQL